ncbi:MAG: metalloprotease PmbA [Pseudomonadota bacterium]
MTAKQPPVGMSLPDGLDVSFDALLRDVLARAAQGGADQAEAGMHRDIGISVTARQRDIETIEYQDDRSLGITVYRQKCKGSASTSDFTPEAIAATVDKALYIATQTGADEAAGLADAELMATAFPDLQLDHAWPISVEEMQTLALRCESEALDAHTAISNSEGATVGSHRSYSAYANSHGFQAGRYRSSHSISCAVIAGEGDGMQRDYDYTTDRDPSQLRSAESVGASAAEAAVARLAPRKLQTQTATVLFRADIARSLVGHLLSAISGGAQYRKASFLLDAVGEQLFPPFVTISESPFLPGGPGSTAYDNEGVATQAREIVAEGTLQGLVLSSYSARRLGLQTTGNAGGVHNALVTSTAGDRDALMRQMDRGFLVTELMGQGVNPVTGDYSRGAAGFWVENGEIAYPVSEVTIAGNLRDMFRQMIAIGDDVDRRSVVQTGSILVDGMTIAGS